MFRASYRAPPKNGHWWQQWQANVLGTIVWWWIIWGCLAEPGHVTVSRLARERRGGNSSSSLSNLSSWKEEKPPLSADGSFLRPAISRRHIILHTGALHMTLVSWTIDTVGYGAKPMLWAYGEEGGVSDCVVHLISARSAHSLAFSFT